MNKSLFSTRNEGIEINKQKDISITINKAFLSHHKQTGFCFNLFQHGFNTAYIIAYCPLYIVKLTLNLTYELNKYNYFIKNYIPKH